MKWNINTDKGSLELDFVGRNGRPLKIEVLYNGLYKVNLITESDVVELAKYSSSFTMKDITDKCEKYIDTL